MANSSCRLLGELLCFGLLTLANALGAWKEVRSSDAIGDVAPSPLLAPAPGPAPAGTCQSRVEIFGYECQEHTVTTEDGYILSLQRIPNGRLSSPSRKAKAPVLLQHGLLLDGASWLLNSPDESLGYILADNGYDVWIANSRGTLFSLGHTWLSPDDPAYWDWTWDELAAYDLPAMFQYVYQKTDQQKIHYVGHSLGTLIALAALSQQDLLAMIRSAALLCPVFYLDQISSPAAVDLLTFAEVLYNLGYYQFNLNGKEVHELLNIACNQRGIDCLDVFTGENCCLNSSVIQVFLEHEPHSTATKNLVHLSQMVRRGTVTKFDYDSEEENTKHYGQHSPPAYNISAIPNDLPLFISYGSKDTLADVKDVEHLLDTLKSQDRDKLTVRYVHNYAHADFVLGVNTNQVVYGPMLTFFKLQ